VARHPSQKQRATPPKWDFLSFPTFCGFSAGMFAATVLAALGFFFVYILSGLLVVFCLSHITARQFLAFRSERKREREDEEERERRALAARARAAQDESAPDADRARRRRRRRANS
jgi:hypothetical protein